jgi:hypothetical protein
MHKGVGSSSGMPGRHWRGWQMSNRIQGKSRGDELIDGSGLRLLSEVSVSVMRRPVWRSVASSPAAVVQRRRLLREMSLVRVLQKLLQ